MSDYTIKLTREAAQSVAHLYYGAYRLQVTASDAIGDGFDSNVFIFKRMPPSPYNTDTVDIFEAVAGPAQMASFPVGEPDPDANWPYFRSSVVTLDVISSAEATYIWEEIKRQVAQLTAAMSRLTNLQLVEEVWIPSEPVDDSSQSDSGA